MTQKELLMDAVTRDFDGRVSRKALPGKAPDEVLEAEYEVAGGVGGQSY